MALLGILAALSTLLVVLGSLISVNTIFFTALAAFLLGIVLLISPKGQGIVFFLVCLALDFFLNPNKLHVFLYLGLGGYILLAELTYEGLKKKVEGKRLENLHRALRLVIFLLGFLPIFFFLPDLLLAQTRVAEFQDQVWFELAAVVAGVVFWAIYDLAYGIFKREFYKRFHDVVK